MQDEKKLAMMNTKIDPQRAIFLEKSESLYELYKSYIIGKQYYTPSCVINQIDIFKRTT